MKTRLFLMCSLMGVVALPTAAMAKPAPGLGVGSAALGPVIAATGPAGGSASGASASLPAGALLAANVHSGRSFRARGRSVHVTGRRGSRNVWLRGRMSFRSRGRSVHGGGGNASRNFSFGRRFGHTSRGRSVHGGGRSISLRSHVFGRLHSRGRGGRRR